MKMADTSEQEGTTCEEHVSSSPKSSPRRPDSKSIMKSTEDQAGGGGDNVGPSPPKMKNPTPATTGADDSTDLKLPGGLGDVGATVSTSVMISPKHKDPDRIKKDREREERVRQARERLEEERKKKLLELQEQQRQAQENRDKQLELRRKKIEDLRRREGERRAEVERRRREREAADRNRRESLLVKAEERVARYEAWKRSGQKGPPPGVSMPTAKHLSVSTSVLYHKRHSDFSSSGALNTATRPDSLLALNTIPEGRRSVLAPSNLSASRPKSVMSLSTPSPGSSSGGGVRMRENKSPRKPRPVSVGTGVATFVSIDAAKDSPRSKSTDRLARDRPRSRGAVSASRADDREEEEKKTPDKSGVKMSRRTLERLSTPRQAPVGDGDRKESSPTPKREPNLTRVSPRKAYSTSNLAMPRQKSSLREKTTKEAPSKPQTPKDTAKTQTPKDNTVTKSQTPKDSTPKTQTPKDSTPKTPKDSIIKTQTPKDSSVKSQTPKDSVAKTPKDSKVMSQTPTETTETPEVTMTPSSPSPVQGAPTATSTPRAPSPVSSRSPVRALSPTPGADEDGGSSTPSRSTPTPMEKSSADITAEEYKAKLAEKRKQAREKAEREAEEERKRQEELERLEEERRLQEEEEQRRLDEEALRIAEEARRAEEERLQRAIEAEEARKAEEAARIEQERLAKEEAERKAKEEAERLEQERQEKARRDEEERLERKKRLELIMKRVKPDSSGEGAKDSPRSFSSSPARSGAATVSSNASARDPDRTSVSPVQSGQGSESEERKRSMDSTAEESRSPANGTMSPANNASSPVPFVGQETTSMQSSSSQENMLDTKDVSSPRSMSPVVSREQGSSSEADKPRFKSPLLQKLVEGRDDAGTSPSGTPRFKSPLLNNILGKTRAGARMGLAQDYSRSSPDLSQMDASANGRGSSVSPTVMAMSSSMIDMDTVNPGSKEDLSKTERGDSSEGSLSNHSSPTRSPRKEVASNGEGSPTKYNTQPGPKFSLMESSTVSGVMTSSTAWNPQDSGVSLGSDEMQSSVGPSLQVSLNGHNTVVGFQDQALQDSSISLQSSDSVSGSLTNSAVDSQPPDHSGQDKNFEELIDLSLKPSSSQSGHDLVHFNQQEEDTEELTVPPPIIAFEESSAMRRQDVPDVLS